jgi:TonB family protein
MLALAFGLVGISASQAGDLNDPIWASAPSRADWAKAYPAHAAQSGISGAVKLRCAATPQGSLAGCAVVEETPTGEGFGAAALSLASAMELKPTGQDGKSVSGQSVVVPVRFEPGLLLAAPVITNPDWLRRPTEEELVQYFPARASAQGGRAVVECVLTNRGLTEGCSVQAEDPPGHGYGAAALAMTSLFLMRPMTVDGLPVGGDKVTFPIKFGPGGDSQPAEPTLTVLKAAPWSAAPTRDQMWAAYPKAAIGKVAAAHVVLRCGFGSSGRLDNCDTLTESPEGQGFGSAARSLARDFQLVPDPHLMALNKGRAARIDIPFDFRDPSQSVAGPEIYNPVWLKGVDPAAIPKLFPQAATKAGYKQGGATVECSVARDGALADCAVVSEDPAHLGFGDVALAIASVMQMNPWTLQGSPVEGAKIDLPIKLVLPDKPAPQPAKP